jgi:uncharacterized membrane protein
MPEDLESILRKSLDQVDRDNKRLKRTSVILVVIVVVSLEVLAYLSLRMDVKTLVMSEFGILVLAEVALALRTWMTVASSTRKILKAIELLSKQ